MNQKALLSRSTCKPLKQWAHATSLQFGQNWNSCPTCVQLFPILLCLWPLLSMVYLSRRLYTKMYCYSLSTKLFSKKGRKQGQRLLYKFTCMSNNQTVKTSSKHLTHLFYIRCSLCGGFHENEAMLPSKSFTLKKQKKTFTINNNVVRKFIGLYERPNENYFFGYNVGW